MPHDQFNMEVTWKRTRISLEESSVDSSEFDLTILFEFDSDDEEFDDLPSPRLLGPERNKVPAASHSIMENGPLSHLIEDKCVCRK